MAIILKNDIKNFVGSVHVADIHIRLLKRHDEYIEIFDELYDVVDKTPLETVVCIAGDLLHSKSDLSPECIRLASQFLKNLADRRPTVLIAGNHDAILSNKNRLDSLSPIVMSLNHPNLYYLKKSGLYILGDILFNNMSVFDPIEDYIKATDIPSKYINSCNHIIGLYHGPVNNAYTDIGYRVANKSITTDLFDGHDMVFLGDIHAHQVLQEYDDINHKPIIVYPGSICQQDHGEGRDNHGYVLWNLKTRKFLQMNLNNSYGYFTIDIDGGKLITDISDIPKNVRLRVRCKESVATEVKKILNDIKQKSNILESVYFRVDDSKSSMVNNNMTDLNLNDIGSHEYQNKLIGEYLLKKHSDKDVDAAALEKIFEINKTLNSLISKETSSRNIKWIPKKFEFSNMFSYGEDNVIDFTKINGITGLFANNASGKSSIFSALTFCLFDKCERTFKASYILNAQKMSFKCKFNFEINGVDFFIERVGVSDKKGNVKVDVKFWKIDPNKEGDERNVDLSGDARRNTNDLIRDYIGTYEDFILTTLSVQTSNNKSSSAFVDMGQTERKDLLSQFMGLTIFDSLYQRSTDKLKEINASLKEYKNDNVDSDAVLEDFKNRITFLKNSLDGETKKFEMESNRKNEIGLSIIEENKKLIKLSDDIFTDIKKLESEQVRISKLIEFNEVKLPKLREENDVKKLELASIESDLEKYTSENIENNYKVYINLCDKKKEAEISIDKKKIIVSNKLEKLKKLEKHEYDPNCKYCVNNIFVKDAEETKKSLEFDRGETVSLVEYRNELTEKLQKLGDIETKYKDFSNKKQNKNSIERFISLKENEILKVENVISTETNNLNNTNSKIQLYYQKKDAIENNKNVECVINKLNAELKTTNEMLKNINKNIIDLNAKLVSVEKDNELFVNNLNKIKEYESMQKAYELYTEAVSRDGIPFELISNAVPVIEKEVNSILHQIVDFSVKIETDGKNVMAYLIYDNKSWPLEMSSGMEKFISSIAIRVALINISNLPKTSGLVLDEGFGVLDASNLTSINLLLRCISAHFDFILIISHLDVIRDVVDTSLEITKTSEGYSKIKYD